MRTGDLTALYRNRFEGRENLRQGLRSVIARDFFSRWIEPTATILDPGYGYCEFVNAVQARRKHGIDLNPEARIREAEDVEILEQDSTVARRLPGANLDVVYTSNFFEHLPDKTALLATISEAHRWLRSRGCLTCGPQREASSGSVLGLLSITTFPYKGESGV